MISLIQGGTREAVAAMQAEWDANGGLEVEAAMQEFYEANKDFAG